VAPRMVLGAETLDAKTRTRMLGACLHWVPKADPTSSTETPNIQPFRFYALLSFLSSPKPLRYIVVVSDLIWAYFLVRFETDFFFEADPCPVRAKSSSRISAAVSKSRFLTASVISRRLAAMNFLGFSL